MTFSVYRTKCVSKTATAVEDFNGCGGYFFFMNNTRERWTKMLLIVLCMLRYDSSLSGSYITRNSKKIGQDSCLRKSELTRIFANSEADSCQFKRIYIFRLDIKIYIFMT